MKLFAIGDLHLSGYQEKSMSIFGNHWDNHWQRIQDDWRSKVTQEDVVLLCGDLSWAMKLEEARVDLEEICALPGKKILLKGNHDYWWSSLNKVEQLLSGEAYPLQNNSFVMDEYAIVGTRGWTVPGEKQLPEEDLTIYRREVLRLQLSIDSLPQEAAGKTLVAMTHFPPFQEKHVSSELTQELSKAGVTQAVYGHLHAKSFDKAYNGVLDGVEYHLVSCDYLQFKLKQII